jgi:hypothetical protein
MESNLVRHAKKELDLLGCEDEDIEYMLKIVQAFSDVGPSGSQASWMIGILVKLLCFENLTDLTNDPSEWIDVDPNVWQSTRRADAFSNNGGKTYYLTSEGASQNNPHPTHPTAFKRK